MRLLQLTVIIRMLFAFPLTVDMFSTSSNGNSLSDVSDSGLKVLFIFRESSLLRKNESVNVNSLHFGHWNTRLCMFSNRLYSSFDMLSHFPWTYASHSSHCSALWFLATAFWQMAHGNLGGPEFTSMSRDSKIKSGIIGDDFVVRIVECQLKYSKWSSLLSLIVELPLQDNIGCFSIMLIVVEIWFHRLK